VKTTGPPWSAQRHVGVGSEVLPSLAYFPPMVSHPVTKNGPKPPAMKTTGPP
jgi:hypothetical protein